MIRKTLIAAALAAATVPALAAGEAKNVIFFLGDGYGPVPYTAARIYSVGEDGSLVTDTMPYTARVKTYSFDAQTTDSAPSMAAYMTGVKQRNDVLSMSSDTIAIGRKPTAVVVTNPDNSSSSVSNAKNNCEPTNGTPVDTLLEIAKTKSKLTGVVTTARLTHATPAATYSHVCYRDAEYDIASQAVPGGTGTGGAAFNSKLGTGVDVMMGGISYYWKPYVQGSNPRGRPDGRDLTNEMKAAGYTYVTSRTEMAAAPTVKGSKLLGLYDFALAQGHMSFDLDRDPSKEPSLAEMTAKAIDVLKEGDNGYFLMVEGGRIDHALHNTNAKRALQDAEAFDEAIRMAISKVDLSNTLIVVTADHDHTMAFNGYGKRGGDILGLNIDYAKRVPSQDADGNSYSTLVFGNGSNRPDTRTNLASGTVTANDYTQEVAIRYGSPGSESHGGGDVMLFATGAGSKTFKGTIDNTKVFTLLKSAAGY